MGVEGGCRAFVPRRFRLLGPWWGDQASEPDQATPPIAGDALLPLAPFIHWTPKQ